MYQFHNYNKNIGPDNYASGRVAIFALVKEIS